MLTFIDFFSGIGGFRLGLESVGMKCIGYCEKDKFAVRTYNAMYNTKEEWYSDDITKLKSTDIPKADIWCGGSPCQNLSIAGKRSGLYGDRSSLFFKFTELLKGKKEEDRPQWIILENVKGLLSSNKGWDFLEYLSEMDKCGYDCEWQVFNSADFGVPQHRERVYTVGHLRTRGRREILPIYGENSTIIKQLISGKQGYRVYDTSGISVTLASSGGGAGAKTGLYLIDQTLASPQITDKARCLTSRYNSGIGNRKAVNSGVLEIGNYTPSGYHSGRVILPEGISPAVMDNHGTVTAVMEIKVHNTTKQGYDIATVGDGISLSYPTSATRRGRVGHSISQTITACEQQGAVVTDGKEVRIRRLTPRECFRLQGFNDELFEKAREVCSDTQLYKQAGNAVTVNVVRAIGEKIAEGEK